jgi:hypothetical protein
MISLQQHLAGIEAAKKGYESHKSEGHSIAIAEAICHYNEFVGRKTERESVNPSLVEKIVIAVANTFFPNSYKSWDQIPAAKKAAINSIEGGQS